MFTSGFSFRMALGGVMKKILTLLLVMFLVIGCSSKVEHEPVETEGPVVQQEPEETPTPENENSHDVVIIGAGGAGLAAALAAYEAGADILVLEKMPVAGGNTNLATGGMNAAETKFQEALGIEDTVDLFVKETMEGGYNKADEELVRFMAENSAATIDWLDSMGITLDGVSFSGGFSVARIHRPKDGSSVGSYLVSGLLKQIEEKGIKIAYNTKAEELVVDDNNKVVGVKATGPDGEVTYSAKAVIVAAGGFGANLEMVVKYQPGLEGYVTTNAAGATGDGILMVEKINGDTVDMDQIQIHPTVVQETSQLVTEALRGEGAILVNQEGKRFTNELLTRDKVSAAEIAQSGSYAYILFDEALREKNKVVDKYIAQGFTTTGDTLPDLARQLDIDPAVLEETLSTYNAYVEAGKDEEFEREEKALIPLVKEPYYAIKIAPGIHHTMGGIKINTQTQVLDKDGNAIEGLYAAGEVTGGIHGGNRIGGNAVADIMVFGREAGKQAGTYAMENGGHGIKETSNETSNEVLAPTEPGIYKDGTYTEKPQGNNGPFTVEVVIENGNVTQINFPDNTETESLFKAVEDSIVPEIIKTQSTEGIDVVSSVTNSSNAVLEAVEKILSENKK